MLAVVLLASGLVALGYGSWRGYAAARAALLPLLRDGDETRSLIDATRPVLDRTRIRQAARNVVVAVAWIGVAMYGLYLATVGTAVLR